MEFKSFTKIPRFSREMIVTEKIDGTNGIIAIGENGEFQVGSRNKWLTDEMGNIQSDNAGFAQWAIKNRDSLMALGVGFHYGEWWGSGCQRGYGLKHGEKRWSLFNVARWCLADQEPQRIPTADPRIEKYQERLPACCHLVPVLFRGLFDTARVEEALEELRNNGSKAAPGFMKPEGVVCFHVAGNFGFKTTLEKDHERKSA